MTLKEAIFDQTNGGYDVFEYYIPEQNLSKPFFLREEKTPSSNLKAINGVYYVRDFGDPEYDVYSKNCIDFVMHQQNISGYYEAKKKIVEDLKLKIDLNAFSGIERHYGYEISKDLKELSEKQRKYLNGRGITDEAIEFRDIKACTHYFPQVNEELEAIAFPYYDDKRYLVNIKYRSFHKNPKTGKVERLFTMHKGGKLELYGIHKLTSDITECFFVEGETDAATMDSYFFEMGIQPMLTISIPNGVNSLMSIPDVKKRLEHIKTFYVFSDEGKAGKGLETKIVDMFGKHRCKIVPKSGGDDVNEIYQKNGYKGIGECIDNAYYLPVEGIITANNVMNKLYDMHLNGISRGATLGYPNFDKLVSFITPQLTLVTGIPGHGKSTALKQITVRLARNDGWKMGFFSPEDPDAERFYRKVMMQVTGKAFKINSRNIPPEYQITDNEFWQAQKFASEHFFFLNPISYDLESILELCASAIVKYNLKSIVIDPFNYISIENRDTGTINAILTRLNQFKKEHNVHIFLVAHPTKMKKKTKYEDGKKIDSFEFEVPTPYDVAHTSDFYNQVDNSFTFYRNADDSVEWHVHKFRDDDIGSTGKAVFRFNHWSKTYDELF